jgi:hypothetical protein
MSRRNQYKLSKAISVSELKAMPVDSYIKRNADSYENMIIPLDKIISSADLDDSELNLKGRMTGYQYEQLKKDSMQYRERFVELEDDIAKSLKQSLIVLGYDKDDNPLEVLKLDFLIEGEQYYILVGGHHRKATIEILVSKKQWYEDASVPCTVIVAPITVIRAIGQSGSTTKRQMTKDDVISSCVKMIEKGECDSNNDTIASQLMTLKRDLESATTIRTWVKDVLKQLGHEYHPAGNLKLYTKKEAEEFIRTIGGIPQSDPKYLRSSDPSIYAIDTLTGKQTIVKAKDDYTEAAVASRSKGYQTRKLGLVGYIDNPTADLTKQRKKQELGIRDAIDDYRENQAKQWMEGTLSSEELDAMCPEVYAKTIRRYTNKLKKNQKIVFLGFLPQWVYGSKDETIDNGLVDSDNNPVYLPSKL